MLFKKNTTMNVESTKDLKILQKVLNDELVDMNYFEKVDMLDEIQAEEGYTRSDVESLLNAVTLNLEKIEQS